MFLISGAGFLTSGVLCLLQRLKGGYNVLKFCVPVGMNYKEIITVLKLEGVKPGLSNFMADEGYIYVSMNVRREDTERATELIAALHEGRVTLRRSWTGKIKGVVWSRA